MPSKNTVKVYTSGYYHIYNRGVEKREIFNSTQDCKVFLYYLKIYLLPLDAIKKDTELGLIKARFLSLNLSNETDLVSFALMPNHFHLLIRQTSTDGITKLMKRLTTGYSMYFNKKNNRVGPLFQGVFKACYIPNDEYLLHLSRYIHLNPHKLNTSINFNDFNSYPYFLGTKYAEWIKPQSILQHFNASSNVFSYKSFVEDYKSDSLEVLGDLILEES